MWYTVQLKRTTGGRKGDEEQQKEEFEKTGKENTAEKIKTRVCEMHKFMGNLHISVVEEVVRSFT